MEPIFQDAADRGPKIFVQISAALFAVALMVYGFVISHRTESPLAARQMVREKQNPFATISLTAQSAIVYDIVRGQILYEKNAETQLPLASLAKLMTAVVAEETIPRESEVGVSAAALSREGDSGLRTGEKWDLLSLIRYTLVVSSNDGAAALASAASALKNDASFAELMNDRARTLGMTQTYFLNETGLDILGGISGAYGSAKDMAILLSYAIKNHNDLFSATTQKAFTAASLDDKPHIAENTNPIVERLPSVVASKTGWTDLAGGNLAIIFEAGPAYPIAVVILNSTYNDRFTDVEKLSWAAIQSLDL